MFKPRPCGCKGIRTCLLCENELGIDKLSKEPNEEILQDALEFCYLCGDRAWPGSDVWRDHPNHHDNRENQNKGGGMISGEDSDGYLFPGVYLQPDFLSETEEREMVAGCDELEWTLSQSGRRKQNFGPKTNFKKKKISGNSFEGFPTFSRKFQDKLAADVPILKNFLTIEQCAIEYRPETGACIDPHIDDCWVWGEHVISVSLLSDSVLTMNKYLGGSNKYNLDYHFNLNGSKDTSIDPPDLVNTSTNYPIVRIPMPRRSILILYGPARYSWEHAVLRKDITDRRICMAYREFTKEYLPQGDNYESKGKEIIEKAKNFF